MKYNTFSTDELSQINEFIQSGKVKRLKTFYGRALQKQTIKAGFGKKGGVTYESINAPRLGYRISSVYSKYQNSYRTNDINNQINRISKEKKEVA